MPTYAIRMHETGAPDVLKWEEVAVGTPGTGEVLLRHSAIGLNYIDTYHRSGLYPVPSLPAIPGLEAAGVVESTGPDVTELRPGDRVAYGTGPIGAYTERRVIAADRLVKLPDGIDDATAAAALLKGMTAQYLVRRTFRVEPGHVVLFHAAAGGTGLIACQWLKALGAIVIGTVGSDEKVEQAKQHGCDHVIVAARENMRVRTRQITDGRGVDVVYDGVGRATFVDSLDCLKRRGMLVSFGNASGPAPAFEPALLAAKGSLYVTRPTLFDYTSTREELLATASDLFDVVLSGKVRVHVGAEIPLREAARAHADLESRRTVGSTVLTP
jgi:NADPH2:quinone reductase